ncbi:MAG: hypothetical protein GYA23_05770 [Methanomicrobiales archaeon]|nr:hypothetical protein [Methanomicrobiales archaeon]
MDRKLQILLIAGIIITAMVFFINIYLAGIVFVVLATIIMSLLIMQDSTHLPDVVAELSDDAKSIVLRNTGNSPALNLHTALVPENIEFDIPSLGPDESHIHPMGRMIEEIKVVLTFENERSEKFSRTFRLSAYEESFEPLKPMIPLFRWK